VRSLLLILLVLLPACVGDGELPGPDAFSSNLPLLLIDTAGVDVDADEAWEEDDTRAWIPVTARLIEPDAEGTARLGGPPSWSGLGGLHVRGSSSTDYDKKSYAFETWDASGDDEDVALLGLPSEEDWVLHGPFSDKTLMRNHLMYTWSRSIGRYAARTAFVEVVLDDGGDGISLEEDYRGVYVLMEKIKRGSDRVAITRLDPEDSTEPGITGGYLLKKDWVDWERPETFVETSTYEDVILLVDPGPDEITEVQREWLTDHLNAFEEALAGPDFANPSSGYAQYLDVDSFIDHHLLVELGRNVDGYVLSTFLHKDRGRPLHMGPIWDYNGALGNADYFEAWLTDGWHFDNPEFPADNPTAYLWYERLFEDPAFRERYASRWQELRSGPLATSELMAEVERTAALLQQGAAQRNFERWPVLGEYVWPNAEGAEERTTYEDEVDHLSAWLIGRLDWMDEAIEQDYAR